MIGGFFLWWADRMAELLPAWLRRPAVTRLDALVIIPTTPLDRIGRIAVFVRRNGRETELGQFTLGAGELAEMPRPRGRPAVLRIDRAELLEKTLTLPLAARGELDQALAFEMDRETPFAAEDLHWNYHIERVDQQHGRLLVRLLLIQKARVAPLLAALAQSGVAPKWLEIADGPADCGFLPLADKGGHPHRPSRWLLAGAGAACAILALAAVAMPFARQAMELAALDRELAASRATAAEAEALRRESERLVRGAELVRRTKESTARPLDVLAGVTRLLPDDTYLTEIELRRNKLTLTGRSAAAARLIGAFAADPTFRSPGFAAPVTHVGALRADIFTITAEVGPPR